LIFDIELARGVKRDGFDARRQGLRGAKPMFEPTEFRVFFASFGKLLQQRGNERVVFRTVTTECDGKPRRGCRECVLVSK
jgi:hypothetical protein